MNSSPRQSVSFFLNGERQQVGGAHALMMLADFLRYERELRGTKIVCAEGDCGACTVLLSREGERFMPINACIAPVALFDGCELITVEALAEKGTLTAVQQSIVEHHGSQCGYCTPGFVMAMTSMFEKPCQNLTLQKVKNCLTGNLCRCTGYQPLIDAALAVDVKKLLPLAERFSSHAIVQELRAAKTRPLHIVAGDRELFAPLNVDDAVQYRNQHPDARVISGATDLGVLVNKGRFAPTRYVSLHLIPELGCITDTKERIVVGATASLSALRRFVKKLVPNFANFLDLFASPQIKNVATLVGNVANGSPIADTIPFLMVTDGAAHVTGVLGMRTIPIAELYSGYKTLALKPSEIITHISFAKLTARHHLRLEKVSQRKDLDISTVNIACLFDVDTNNHVHEARVAVGGVAASVMRLKAVEAELTGKAIDDARIEIAAKKLALEITPLSDLRGSADYRRALVDGLFRRYCHGVVAHEF